MTPSSNQDWTWLESRPLTSSSPLTERQRHWTRPSPGRNDRGAESVTTLRFVLWAEHTPLCTDGTRLAMDFGPDLEDPTFSQSPRLAATRQPSRCEIQARPPRGRRLSSSRCCKLWMAGSGRPPGGGTSCGPRLSVQPSVSSREQVAGAHGSCRDYVRDADAEHLGTRGCCRSRSFSQRAANIMVQCNVRVAHNSMWLLDVHSPRLDAESRGGAGQERCNVN